MVKVSTIKRSVAAGGPNKLHATFEAKANQFREAGEMKKAEQTYLEWIATAVGSGEAEARYAYAAFLMRQEKYCEAKSMVERSIELDGNSFNSRVLLACILEYQKDFAKAIEAYSFAHTSLSAQASSQQLGTLLCDRGNLYSSLGEIEKSTRDYKEGLKLFPTLYMAQWDLATILRDNGDFAGAQAHFDLAVQSNDLTQQQMNTYVEFLCTPAFENRYDEMCQVAKFPCHSICGAVSIDLMFLNWSKLSPGLRNCVRHACTCAFNNVTQKYQLHAQRYRSALAAETDLLTIVTENIVAFLMGDASTFE